MMDITKSRKEFEAYLKGNDCSPVGWLKDEYWEVWKAARESIVIDLPPKISELNRMPDNGAILLEAVNYDEAIDDCAEAIRAAGIRIKGESE